MKFTITDGDGDRIEVSRDGDGVCVDVEDNVVCLTDEQVDELIFALRYGRTSPLVASTEQHYRPNVFSVSDTRLIPKGTWVTHNLDDYGKPL